MIGSRDVSDGFPAEGERKMVSMTWVYLMHWIITRWESLHGLSYKVYLLFV